MLGTAASLLRLVALVALLAAVDRHAAARDAQLLVGTDQWPPYEFVQDEAVTGLCTRIVFAVLERMGERAAPPGVYPWQRGLEMLARGELDILYSGIFDARRLAFARYGAEPLVESRWVVLARAGEGSRRPFAGLEALEEGRVGMVIGYSYTPEADAWASSSPLVHRVASNERLLAMLAQGRVDYAVGDALNLRHLARTRGLGRAFVELGALPGGTFGLLPLFSRARLGQDFVDRFDAALREFKASAEYGAILARFLR